MTINDAGGSSTTDSGTATVTDAPLTSGTAILSGGVEGVTPTTLSAKFSDADLAAPTGDFSGTINWGDGTSTNFTSAAVSGAGGAYTVSGSHQYADEGNYAATVTVNDDGGSSTTDTSNSVTVTDVPLTAGTATLTGGVEGATPTTLSAKFSDADLTASTARLLRHNQLGRRHLDDLQ